MGRPGIASTNGLERGTNKKIDIHKHCLRCHFWQSRVQSNFRFAFRTTHFQSFHVDYHFLKAYGWYQINQ